MKRSFFLLTLIGLAFLATACTAHVHDLSLCVEGEAAGFWDGLWHGLIAPFTFIISLFSDSVTVFETNNNGGWYLFGFLLGIGAFSSGSSKGARRARGSWNNRD